MAAGEHKPATLEELEEMRKAAWDARRPHEGQWHLNIAFYRGHQWVMWDGLRLAEVHLDDDEPRPVDNRIKAIVRKALAKETKNRPVPAATPSSTDDDDIEGALLAEEVFEDLWDKLRCPHKNRSARWWRRLTGAGFLKITWDRTKGRYVDVLVDENGQPKYDDNGRLLRTDRDDLRTIFGDELDQLPRKRIAMGEINVELRNPFQVLVDPIADENGLDAADYIIDESIQKPEKLQARYPGKADKLTADSYATQGPTQMHLPGISRRPEGPKNGIVVRELWQRSCPEYPHGRRVVWACEQILYDGINPYADMEAFRGIPLVMFGGDPNGGTFWPGAPVTDLISPQTRLNKREAQIDANADRAGNSHLMYPEGMEFEGFTGQPGEHLQYPALGTPDAVPSYLQAPQLPAYLVNEPDRMVGSLQEISGQHEVSSAQVPAGVTAASAISMLLEQDDTQLGPDIEDADLALEAMAGMMLELAGEFYDDERSIEIAGEDGGWEIRRFRGDDLRNHYRLKIRTGTPQSKAAKQAAMTTLMDLMFKYGGPEALNPRNLRRFLRDFEVGGLERMFADLDVVERKVARENRRMLQGTAVAVNQWDRHMEEIAAHNEERMTGRYERLAGANPEVARAFQAHIDAHAAELARQLAPSAPAPGADSNGNAQPGSPNGVAQGSLALSGPPTAVPSP